MQLDYGRVIIGLLAFSIFSYEGFRQMYRAKHVDRLERKARYRQTWLRAFAESRCD
jgi:hypothetical protein